MDQEPIALTPMTPLVFTCPECGSYRLEEVLENAIVAQMITLWPTGEYDEATETEIFDGYPRYQCGTCGFVLQDDLGQDIRNSEDAAEWIIKQNRKEEDDDTPT